MENGRRFLTKIHPPHRRYTVFRKYGTTPDRKTIRQSCERRIIPTDPAVDLQVADRPPLHRSPNSHSKRTKGTTGAVRAIAPPATPCRQAAKQPERREHHPARHSERCKSQRPNPVESEIEFSNPPAAILTRPPVSPRKLQQSSPRRLTAPEHSFRPVPTSERYSTAPRKVK